MKLVSWNCNGALRKKFEYLLSFDADIYVIQECENPAETEHSAYIDWAQNYLWIGDSKNKGLGVFAKSSIKLTGLDWSDVYQNHRVKYFLPCTIEDKFDLLAVWTHQNDSPTFAYIGQFWKYLQIHKNKLSRAVIAGDFNSSSIWDVWDRWWNHADIVRELGELGLESIYHKCTGEEQGKETQPTFYLHRNLTKSYHIDYIFAKQEFIKGMLTLEIGPIEKWLTLSDHMPVIGELDL